MTKPSVTERAHAGLHKLPGMPDHSEAEHRNHRGGRPSRNHPRAGHVHREPKVLVGWQNAIARFFSRGSK
jgi:hypothetical protein